MGKSTGKWYSWDSNHWVNECENWLLQCYPKQNYTLTSMNLQKCNYAFHFTVEWNVNESSSKY